MCQLINKSLDLCLYQKKQNNKQIFLYFNLTKMEITLNLAPNKHMLDLNFDQNSSEDDTPKSQNHQQKPKFEKVYDLDPDLLKRDKFISNKVQKGLFISESDTYEYDTFQVQHKPQLPKPLSNPSKKQHIVQKTQPDKQEKSQTTIKTPLKGSKNILSVQFSQKSSSDQENSIEESQMQSCMAQKKLQSEAVLQSKKKLLQLDFSESSSDEEDKSQQSRDQQINKNKPQQKKKQIRKKQAQSKEKKQQESSSNSGEQESSSNSGEQELKQQQKKQQKQPPQPIHLKDFQFTKEPQYEVLDEIRPQQRARAIISRSRSGLNLLWPQYQILMESNKQQILCIKKQAMFLKGEYKIYSRTNTGHNRYFGKLMANITGTEYQIYISENGVHENLKAQMYFPNDSKGNQPRYFIMISLIDGYNISDLVVTDPNNFTLKELYKNEQNKNKMMILHTRKPIYHEQIRGFVLNFSGRVNMPSIKNFILEDVQTQKEVIMFGKIDKENFRLQISSPLNCVLGAAVALIQFEGRFME